MNSDDQAIVAKIMSDIKMISDSFSRREDDMTRSLSDMSRRISTGVYLVTQHMSDDTSLKVSLRLAADDLIAVAYEHKAQAPFVLLNHVLTVSDKIMSYISVARATGTISDINGLLIERELTKLTRFVTMMLVRGDVNTATGAARDRQDIRLKMMELFDSEPAMDKRSRSKSSDTADRATRKHVSSPLVATPDYELAERAFDREVRPEYGDDQSGQVVGSREGAAGQQVDTLYGENLSESSNPAQPPFTGSMQNSVRLEARPRPQSGLPSSIEQRRATILRYIREHGIVSIKEIADGVPGTSDKTLQRALIDLLSDGAIVRHGDRRWSRYEAVV